MFKNAIAVVSLLCIFVIACENVDDTEMETGEITQELWSYPNQGEILYGETVKADIMGGDFGHRYSFEGVAGETVTFVVELHEPESIGLGVDLSVQDSSFHTIATSSSWNDTKAHVNVTFTEDGIYYIYVGHYFWGWFGRYPYKFGADPHLCAQISMVTSMPDWEGYEFYGVNNYEVGEDGDPWSYFPEFSDDVAATFTVLERDVKMDACNAHIDGSCSDSDSQVCGGSFVGGGVYDNACAFRNILHTESSDFSTAIGGFTTDLTVCEE